MNRVALAIRSNLPDELDWALQSLVRMSFETPDDLHFDRYPALVPALLEKLSMADEFADIDIYPLKLSDGTVVETEDDIGLFGVTSENEKIRNKLDKILEAALVLRNAAINPENARHLSRSRVCVDVLVKCLSLPVDRPSLVELRQYCLDITESVSLFLRPHSSSDPLFRVLIGYLSTDDRGVLVSSLRAIARLVISVDTNLLQAVDNKTVSRICSLIMLDDEELLSVCLDFLYQYTGAPQNIELTGDVIDWRDPVLQLIRLLLYQAQESPKPNAPVPVPVLAAEQNPNPAPTAPPELPTDLVWDLLAYSEPERATQWMRVCFEDDPDGDVTQIALWKAYESRFEEYAKQGKKLLPAADFIKNVTTAFRRAAAMVVTLPQGQQKFIIKGIRPRQVPLSLKGELYISCKWDKVPGVHCGQSFPSVANLFQHILTSHMPAPTDTSDVEVVAETADVSMSDAPTQVAAQDGTDSLSAPSELPTYFCHWNGCERFSITGERDRYKVAAHVRTHIPSPEDNKPAPISSRTDAAPKQTSGLDNTVQSHTVVLRNKSTTVDERGEAVGVPLTAVLILRNIARSETGQRILAGLENELIAVAAVNVALRNDLADLLDLVDEKRRAIQ
ncbi:hypothetical protein V1512DRAFT_265268 [Lipomyces arxii]|uniref:uncharacterized protein n=1 Tax=Lipomyces arxii TaxID=56418 RepID=UPI0034CD2906